MRIASIIISAMSVLMAGCSAAEAEVTIYDFEIVEAYPHDDEAYTQGLFFLNGYLYESTGIRTRSTLRKVALETGEVLQTQKLPDEFFGEGIVPWEDRIIGLTWQAGTGFVFDLEGFDVQRTFTYPGEGWGLTRDDQSIYMSDGTSEIRTLAPDTLEETGRFTVTYKDKPIRRLNELEWVNGEIYANVYQTEIIARIDPATGAVTGLIDLTGLLSAEDKRAGHTDVLNGIAYDEAGGRLFVTGKRWPKLFEIRLVERGTAE